jgi:hypothetical protein
MYNPEIQAALGTQDEDKQNEKMYNPEIQAALGTQDEDKQNKNKHKAETKNNE